MDHEKALCRVERQVYENCHDPGQHWRVNGLRFSMLYEYYQQHYPTSVLFQSVLLTLPLNLDPQETPPTPGQEATGSIEDLYCQVSLT